MASYTDTIEIRLAHRKDYPAICQLIDNPDELFLVHPSGQFPWTPQQLETLATVRTDLTVLCVAGDIIGFANLYGLMPKQHGYIGNVIIARSHRGQGHACHLVTHMLKRLFDTHQLQEARISVFAQNRPARRLYQTFGFQHYSEARRTAPDGSPQRLLHMSLRR